VRGVSHENNLSNCRGGHVLPASADNAIRGGLPAAVAAERAVHCDRRPERLDWLPGWSPAGEDAAHRRLADRGTLFLNAHIQSPLCNPSRTSLMLSLRPTTTGIYGLAPWFANLEAWSDRVTLPQHFKAHGYKTFTAGKIYHGGVGARRCAHGSSTCGDRRAGSV
jgi:hypothetical protein